MSPPSEHRPPSPLVASVVFGVVGLVLLLVGVAISSNGVVVAGVGAASVSLVAALVWREQLIKTWQERRSRGGS